MYLKKGSCSFAKYVLLFFDVSVFLACIARYLVTRFGKYYLKFPELYSQDL